MSDVYRSGEEAEVALADEREIIRAGNCPCEIDQHLRYANPGHPYPLTSRDHPTAPPPALIPWRLGRVQLLGCSMQRRTKLSAQALAP
jgi:hypothetical protein